MPLRRLYDGSPSPLDMRRVRKNIITRQAATAKAVAALQSGGASAPPAGAVGFPQLWPANAFEGETGLSAEMRCLDLLQLVSGQQESIFAGMHCVMNPDEADALYFRAGSDDDVDNPSSGLYGIRNPVSRTVTLRARYLSPGPLDDDLVLHYMNTGSETTILATGGDAWRDVGGGDEYFQVFTSGASAVTVFAVALYLKRAASVASGQFMQALIYPINLEGWPEQSGGSLAIAEVDLDDLSTGGSWMDFSFTAGWTPELETQYAVVLRKSGENESEAYWYQDTDAGGAGYADGYSGYMGLGGEVGVEPTLEPTKDYYLKLLVAGEDTVTLASGFLSDGWQEAEVEVTLRLASDFLASDNLADFYLELPQYMYLNALMLYDHDTRGEVHWRAGHVRTAPIQLVRSGAAVDGAVQTADGDGGAAWVAPQRWVWGDPGWSSAAWNGDPKTSGSTGVIDLSAAFGLPAGIKAVSVRAAMTATSTARSISFSRDAASAGYGLVIDAIIANDYINGNAVIPCDENGDIYCTANGDIGGVHLYVNGYCIEG